MALDSSLHALGQQTQYSKSYDYKVLESISRAKGRAQLPMGANVGRGQDVWHLFEVSYLQPSGKPTALLGRLTVPAGSTHMVESKSLKLYMGGLNFLEFESEQACCAHVEADLQRVIKTRVKFELFDADAFKPSVLDPKQCIDHLDLLPNSKACNAQLLKHVSNQKITRLCHTHLFRSHCPVTHQPDWATVQVGYVGMEFDPAALLSYLVSFREHSGFHESCVEHVFTDLYVKLRPEKLMVQAFFTRRGGIDINPVRVTQEELIPAPKRLIRQ